MEVIWEEITNLASAVKVIIIMELSKNVLATLIIKKNLLGNTAVKPCGHFMIRKLL